jgi:hypothetical protein
MKENKTLNTYKLFIMSTINFKRFAYGKPNSYTNITSIKSKYFKDKDNNSVISDLTTITTPYNNNTATAAAAADDDNNEIVNETLWNKTLVELRQIATTLQLKGGSSLKKEEVICMLVREFGRFKYELSNKTVADLKTHCRQHNIVGYTDVSKAQLIQLILRFYINTYYKSATTATATATDLVTTVDAHSSTLGELKEWLKMEIKKEHQQQQQQQQIKKPISSNPNKKVKQAIPKHVRKIVWERYIGADIIKHKCLCCKQVTIENTNFDCGHVLSEKENGTQEIGNLRPICGACNSAMGTTNMIDFVKQYGLFIG